MILCLAGTGQQFVDLRHDFESVRDVKHVGLAARRPSACRTMDPGLLGLGPFNENTDAAIHYRNARLTNSESDCQD
jgi:hypothetical protein